MSVVTRFILAAVLIATALLRGGEGRAASGPSLNSSWLLDVAALRLGHQKPARVVSWLRRQRAIDSADLGLDGRTVDIRFRSGMEASILPAGSTPAVPRTIREPLLQRRSSLFHRSAHSTGSIRRALLLLPYGTEMDLIQHAQEEAAVLQKAGFAVDQLYDDDVTVAAMADISQYDLVYMVTHSGVNKQGDVVIATGQLANPDNVDPAMKPLIDEGSLRVTAIAGSSLHYFGVRSRFIHDHLVGQFPHNSLLFFNSCSLQKGSLLWQFLEARGAATMLGWDGLALTMDDAPTGAAFFQEMAHGKTVAGALDNMYAAGRGTSLWAGKTAHLGYLGDGTLTLDGSSSAPPTPTATPTDTPPPSTSTAVPASTSTSTPTATPAPPPPLSVTLKRAVRPGHRQVIRASSIREVTVRFRVTYPNGDSQQARRLTGSNGVGTYMYFQPHNKTTSQTRVRVVVTAANAYAQSTVTKAYRIVGR